MTRRVVENVGRALLLVALPIALLAGPAVAQLPPIYKWVDGDGVVHFSDVPSESEPSNEVDTPWRHPLARRLPSPPPVDDYDGLILRQARAHGLEPALVKAVIAAESAFNPLAVSHKGAQGLMQLMPLTADGLGVENPFWPEDNVTGGSRYLRAMLDRYGDVTRALAAYNAGPVAVDRYAGVPPYEETRAYVGRVLHYYRGYHGDFPP